MVMKLKIVINFMRSTEDFSYFNLVSFAIVNPTVQLHQWVDKGVSPGVLWSRNQKENMAALS